MLACAAFTSDDFPMPRAPHSSALLAGYPLAKRSVFSIRMSRNRSMPLSSPISTRLTRCTGASRPSGCQMKASAWLSDPAAGAAGAPAKRCEAMVSSERAIRSAISCPEDAAGPFVADTGDFRTAARRAGRGPVLLDFFDIFCLPDDAPLTGLTGGRKRGKSGTGRVAIGTAAAIVRANLPGPALRSRAAGSSPFRKDCTNADNSCVCPGRGRRRYQQHVDVAAAVRADLRDHVFPDFAAAAEEGEGPRRTREEHPPRRHRRYDGRFGRQSDKSGGRRPDRVRNFGRGPGTANAADDFGRARQGRAGEGKERARQGRDVRELAVFARRILPNLTG